MSNLTYLNDASVLHNLKQRYYAKLIYVRLFHPGKKKRKRFPVSFFFRVSSKPFHCKSRRIRGSAVHERKRWTKTPHWRVTTFFSSFNKIHSWELHVLSRNFDSRLSKIFASFYKTRTRVTTHLSFSLSFPFLFLEKIGNNRLRPIILFTIVFSSFQNKKERVWWSFEILVSGHEIFLFFSPPLLMPSIIEKSMTMMMKNRGISKRRFPFYSSLCELKN